jgi:MFS family permease
MAQATGARNRTLVLVAMTHANAMVLTTRPPCPWRSPTSRTACTSARSWCSGVLNASLLPLAGLTILGGRLGDLIGRRTVFVTGSVLFAGASALGGLAPNFGVLLAARILQGAGGALMLPTTVAIVSSAFTRTEAGRALGMMGGIAAVAGALGPTIGCSSSACGWTRPWPVWR